MSNQALAKTKVEELFNLIKVTIPQHKKKVSWDILSAVRLTVMQGKKTWQNAVRLAILNFLQKTCPDDDPALPIKVIAFLTDHPLMK